MPPQRPAPPKSVILLTHFPSFPTASFAAGLSSAEAYTKTSDTYCEDTSGSYGYSYSAAAACTASPSCTGYYLQGCDSKNYYKLCTTSSYTSSNSGSCVYKKPSISGYSSYYSGYSSSPYSGYSSGGGSSTYSVSGSIVPTWPSGKDISKQMCTAITPAINYVNNKLTSLLGSGVASCACDDNVR